eukprot:CAMPEP_0204579140 /NCGR_PEP_ID=MMETSP0661-20131031/43322_1 /ASSEMBLY_ACC=CAM_ASM_000606 /TAXON_ID=109239 /ORGANISM="Alexandrium margalefi, Strain AMGDE01CS-322" /LENGTH=144 /DNA_ID=CAMNT_0051588123 /DNA_START=78 /DNA_END=512 /DNA_ORIENTATION=+
MMAPEFYPEDPSLNEDLLNCDDGLDALPKKVLCKRGVHLRTPEMTKLSDPGYMEEFNYSLNVCTLRADSKFSGEGAERGFLVWVYYEPDNEEVLLKALRTVGVDLSEREAEEVDPDSKLAFEQTMMYSSKVMLHVVGEYSVAPA